MGGIYVAGHNGMVGSTIARFLTEIPDVNPLTACRSELDLIDQVRVSSCFGLG